MKLGIFAGTFQKIPSYDCVARPRFCGLPVAPQTIQHGSRQAHRDFAAWKKKRTRDLSDYYELDSVRTCASGYIDLPPEAPANLYTGSMRIFALRQFRFTTASSLKARTI